MNKSGLLGKLLFLAIIVVIIMSATIYLSFSRTGLSLSTGDVTIKVDYDPEKEIIEGGKIYEVDANGKIVKEEEVEENKIDSSSEDKDVTEYEFEEEIIDNGEDNVDELNVTENNNTLEYQNISE
jgi:hypothetical protein